MNLKHAIPTILSIAFIGGCSYLSVRTYRAILTIPPAKTSEVRDNQLAMEILEIGNRNLKARLDECLSNNQYNKANFDSYVARNGKTIESANVNLTKIKQLQDALDRYQAQNEDLRDGIDKYKSQNEVLRARLREYAD